MPWFFSFKNIFISLFSLRSITAQLLHSTYPQDPLHPQPNSPFDPSLPYLLTLQLKPEYIPLLTEAAASPEEATAYLQSLSEAAQGGEEPHILLREDSWYLLSVKQQQAQGEVGFHTFWHYFNPAQVAQEETSSDDIAEGIANFVQDWATQSLQGGVVASVNELLGAIEEGLNELKPQAGAVVRDMYPAEQAEAQLSLLEWAAQTLGEMKWTYTRSQDAPMLSSLYSGKAGQWHLFVRAVEEADIVIVYSLCPLKVSENKRESIMRELTQINYGMMIGNFELDLSDGEIRFKTSIDLEGARRDSQLLKNIIHTNAHMMDKYLPDLQRLIQTYTPFKLK